jgi:phosphoglycolate phosphatase-like HAD superfamily hydrolase
MEFMIHLARIGLKNYFVTGAVIYNHGGMSEEVEALGYQVGPGRLVEALVGSSWDKKLPKDEVMRDLCRRLRADPAEAMVIGDGRTEVRAGAIMGCVTISRLPTDAHRARQLHVEAGTNYILPDFTHPSLTHMLTEE